jgi:hypothetical protein
MNASEMFRQLESDTKLLESISQRYSPDSAEFHAVRRAAMSLAYVVMHRREEFGTFMEEMDQELSDEERNELRDRYGIDT